MRGINYPHAWFRDRWQVALPAIAATGSNTVRIVLADGGQWNRIPANEVRQLIEECKRLGMIAVLESHCPTGSDDIATLRRAVDYWIDIRDVLIGQEAYVIINIANEWYGSWNSRPWGDGYVQQIPRLRAAGLTHTLMIDCAGWGQFPQSIFDEGARVVAADPLRNTMFSIHMYEYAGGTNAVVRSNIDRALAVGAPLVIGEFGQRHTSGGQTREVAFQEIMRYSEQTGVGYLGWSWIGNGNPVQYLDIALEWNGSRLSADWGVPLVNHIRQTSRPASVFPAGTFTRAFPSEENLPLLPPPPVLVSVFALLPRKRQKALK
jgi:mannan endo-1,4-beta-mannosidase